MEFTRGSGRATLVGGGPVAAARHEMEASAARCGGEVADERLGESGRAPLLAGPVAEHGASEASARRAWQEAS